MSFWTDKLAGKPTSNARPLASVQAWWAHETEPPETQIVPESTQQAMVERRPKSTGEGPCPECDSGNYMAPSRNATPRCFDCGYPIIHSTSGMSVAKSTPHGKPVRQVLGDGFHPNEFVGRGL